MPDNTARPLFFRSILFATAFAVALLAGGGGAEGPLQNGIIAAAGAFLLLSIAADQFGGRWVLPGGARLPALAALLLLLLPLIQLMQ